MSNSGPEGPALSYPLRGALEFKLRSNGVMEKTVLRIFGCKNYLLSPPELVLPNYIKRANDHMARQAKTRILCLGLNFVPHSNTPVLQRSGTMLSAEPIFSDLPQRTKFSILE